MNNPETMATLSTQVIFRFYILFPISLLTMKGTLSSGITTKDESK